jgi:hypothetical protein
MPSFSAKINFTLGIERSAEDEVLLKTIVEINDPVKVFTSLVK